MRSHATDRSLESIAGAPLAIFEGATSSTTTFTANAIGPSSARTCYTVFTENATPALSTSTNGIVIYGTAGLSDGVANSFLTLRINQNSTISNRDLFLRRTGAQGVSKSLSGRPPGGRYVATWGLNTSGRMFLGLDGDAVVTEASQVMSVAHNQINHQAMTAFTPSRTTLIYAGTHTADQRNRIEAWLRSRRYDPEKLTVQSGPNGSVDGVFDSTYSVPAEVGPTGLPIGRMTRNSSTQMNYGSYIKAVRLNAQARIIPAGTQVTARVWVRHNYASGQIRMEATNDSANYTVTTQQIFSSIAVNTWTLLEWTFTCTQPWRTTETLRAPLISSGASAGTFIDFSDPSIEVLL
jgi:hypothetical protein